MKLEDGRYGPRVILTSPWTPEIADYLLLNNIRELELNYAKGWAGNNLSFLEAMRQLHAFKIIDWEIPSVEPIHALHELRALEVFTHCKTPIRFSQFGCLEDCGLEWRPKSESIFSCTTLKGLFVDRYSRKNVDQFANLTNLTSLAVLNAPVENLSGLSNLMGLRSLRLGNLRRLTSLSGIENLLRLEELKIDTCPGIRVLDALANLNGLKQLHFDNSGDIDSLKPLGQLRNLESVGFVESTNILDGDLSPLFCHQHLSRISFQNRRHYSHRREDFGAAYFGEKLWEGMKAGTFRRLSNRQAARDTVEKTLGVERPKGLWQRIFSR